MKVFVTTGGTSEAIDDVRSVTNFSTGRFGVEIAAAFAEHGCDVEVFASREAQLHATAADLDSTRFTSARSLQELLYQAATFDDGTGPASSVIVQLAAVSDYAPVPRSGKLSSDAEELVVTMRRTPKLIDGLRARAGQRAFLVGAKLTSGATTEETIARGRELLRRAKLNLVIANDLAECRNGLHPVWLLTAEGGALRMVGTRAEVASKIAEFIRRRVAVTWSRTTVADADAPPPEVTREARALLQHMLGFSKLAGLLPSTDGNAVVRANTSATHPVELLVTPRQVPKFELDADDGVAVRVDFDALTVTAWPPRDGLRSSIDTAVSARTFAARPAVAGLLHTHELFGRFDADAAFPYPCGAAEEATAMLAALAAAGVEKDSVCWSANLPFHGQVLALDVEHLERLAVEWAAVLCEYEEHLEDVDAVFDDSVRMVPVLDGTRIVGVVAHVDGGVAVYLSSAARGARLGAVLAKQLQERRLSVLTVDECGVVEYWQRHGFTAVRLDGSGWRLDPPPPADVCEQLAL